MHLVWLSSWLALQWTVNTLAGGGWPAAASGRPAVGPRAVERRLCAGFALACVHVCYVGVGGVALALGVNMNLFIKLAQRVPFATAGIYACHAGCLPCTSTAMIPMRRTCLDLLRRALLNSRWVWPTETCSLVLILSALTCKQASISNYINARLAMLLLACLHGFALVSLPGFPGVSTA